jgi:hypothetical protein
MWAGRLRHNGAAFAALGPARSTAALKGKSPTKGKGKIGKPQPPPMPAAPRASSSAAHAPAPVSATSKASSPAVRLTPTPTGLEVDRSRADFPQVRGVKRASKELAMQAAATAESRSAALLALHQGMTAASSTANACR